jgi:sarcosine oxidase, subunit beta
MLVTRESCSTSDVAIVGAGIVGLSVAFHLAERGLGRVVVYEREGVGAGASGVQPGGVRQQWSTRLNCAMARASLDFYTQLGRRLRQRRAPRFDPCGYLFLAHAPSTLDRLGNDVSTQNDVGVPSRLLTPDEVALLVPGLRADGIAGAAFCSEDGYFDRPQGVVEAFAQAARSLGVDIARGEVRAVEPTGSGWLLWFADGTSAAAHSVVLAASTVTRALVQPLGAELPIVAENRWLFYSEQLSKRVLDPLVVAVDRRFAAKQLADGRLLTSDLGARSSVVEERELWRSRVRQTALELLPFLEPLELPHLVHGVYDSTPDHQAIVGPLPRHAGLFVAAGFSGHGFMMAPEIGRGVTAMVAGEDPGETFAPLRPERFVQGALATESAVV